MAAIIPPIKNIYAQLLYDIASIKAAIFLFPPYKVGFD